MTRYIIFNEDGEQEIETRRYHCPECGCMVTRIRNKSWHEAQNIPPEPDDSPISVDEIDLLRGIRDGRYDPQNWKAELTRIIKVLENK